MKVIAKSVVDLEEDIRELLDGLKWQDVISKGDKVVIKPNFCTHRLKNGVTTNLNVLKYVVEIVKEQTDKIYVGESYSEGKDFDKLESSLDLNCEFVNLSEQHYVRFKTSAGEIGIPKLILESKIVNLPVFKTHVLTGMTFGIKNLFGLIQEGDKMRYHYFIDEVLIKILDNVWPDLNILDATCSMCEGGPTSGVIAETNFLMASKNVVALDLAACELIGLDYRDIGHILKAASIYGDNYDLKSDVVLKSDFKIPKMSNIRRFETRVQSNQIGRAILKHPYAHIFAKRIRRFLRDFH